MVSRSDRSATGVAISVTRVLAMPVGAPASAPPVIDEPWDASDASRREALSALFRQVRVRVGADARVHVTLMPPLAEARCIDLPPLAAEDLRLLLARDLARHVPGGREGHVVQVDSVRSNAEGPRRRLITFASSALVDDVLHAAATAGVAIASISAAPLAWIHRARTDAHGHRWIGVRSADRVHLVRVDDQGLLELRRIPTTAALPGHVQWVATSAEDALRWAATNAARRDEESLWPESVYGERTRRTWRRVRALVGAAAVLALAAGVLEWSSMQRATERLAVERASIAGEVSRVMARRDSLRALERRLAAMRGFEAAAPRWLALLASLERALPDDATLATLRGAADTLLLTGHAERAAPVLESLASSPVFNDVRADAPIRQEVEQGAVVAEHFSIALLGARRSSPP